ncbi:MAG: hypothetical protein ACREEE_03230 [Dongiaceae bacterium]
MIEVIIERWTSLSKNTDFRWSVWRDGSRIQMGGPHGSCDESESEALAYCKTSLRRDPDRVERL